MLNRIYQQNKAELDKAMRREDKYEVNFYKAYAELWDRCSKSMKAKIEAREYGLSMTTTIEIGESPYHSADRLILKEQRNRKSRYYSWLKSINQKVNVID